MGEVAPKLSRRSLLKTGLVGTLVVGIGSVGLAVQRTAPAGLQGTILDADELSVLSAIADRICPPLGPGAPGAKALGVAQSVDALLVQADRETQKGLKLALRVFESALSGALMGERLVPFTQLPPERQDAVLAGWRDSRVGFRRTVFRALSGLVASVYWGEPRTWARIGYGGPPDPAGLRAAYAANLVPLDTLRASKET